MTLLTRRRDQADFRMTIKRGLTPSPIAANQLIGGVIVCNTQAGRDAWIKRLHERHQLHFNYFTKFTDVHGPALQFGHATYHVSDEEWPRTSTRPYNPAEIHINH